MLRAFMFLTGYRCIAGVLLALITANASYADDSSKKISKDISKYEQVQVGTETIVFDKQLLDIYVRLMRYQTAAQDIENYMSGSTTTPGDYLTIAVNNMRIGKKSELLRYLKEIYDKRSTQILQIQRNESCPEDESCSLSYNVEWAENSAIAAQSMYPSLKNVEEYIAFEITVNYKKKSLSHSGLIAYYKSEMAERKIVVYDGIIPQINMVAYDRLPRTKMGRQYAMSYKQANKEKVKELKPSKVWGSIIEPDDGQKPIGYLSGDDENVGGFMTVMSSSCPATCAFTAVTPHSPDPYPLDTGNLTAETQTAIGCMQTEIAKAPHNGTFTVTSGYRPPAYQTHLREVWDKYQLINQMNGPECAEVKANIQEEWNRHDLVAQPGTTSAHSSGTAFDANWSPSNVAIDTLASTCNLSRCVSGDSVHFCR